MAQGKATTHRPWHHPSPAMTLGEAPLYRARDSTLHWVDPLKEPPELHILRVDADTGEAQGDARVLQLADSVSVFRFRRDHPSSYICAYFQGIAYMDEATGKLEVLNEIIPKQDRSIRRFNDGAVDAKGRFWAAEIDRKALAYGVGKLPKDYGQFIGRLWRYDPDGKLHLMDEGFACGNGIAWSPDNKTMYADDSVGQKTWTYDFDLETGNISNKRLLIDHGDEVSEPDGMVIDTNGNLWISVYGTNKVRVYNPKGEHLKDIEFSAKCMTCPTWGGRENNMLFVTSGSDSSATKAKDDEGGTLFLFKDTNATGLPKPEFAG